MIQSELLEVVRFSLENQQPRLLVCVILGFRDADDHTGFPITCLIHTLIIAHISLPKPTIFVRQVSQIGLVTVFHKRGGFAESKLEVGNESDRNTGCEFGMFSLSTLSISS